MTFPFELRTDDGRTVQWNGTSGEDAARRAADCLGVTIVAWRHVRTFVGPVHHSQIIG